MDETLAAAAAATEQAAPEREPETLEEVMSRHRCSIRVLVLVPFSFFTVRAVDLVYACLKKVVIVRVRKKLKLCVLVNDLDRFVRISASASPWIIFLGFAYQPASSQFCVPKHISYH
jgi:hypothetical protein